MHEQNDQSNVTRHTKRKKKTIHYQDTENNRSKLRDDSTVVVTQEIKITMVTILKALVENMDNMCEHMEVSAERWEL